MRVVCGGWTYGWVGGWMVPLCREHTVAHSDPPLALPPTLSASSSFLRSSAMGGVVACGSVPVPSKNTRCPWSACTHECTGNVSVLLPARSSTLLTHTCMGMSKGVSLIATLELTCIHGSGARRPRLLPARSSTPFSPGPAWDRPRQDFETGLETGIGPSASSCPAAALPCPHMYHARAMS